MRRDRGLPPPSIWIVVGLACSVFSVSLAYAGDNPAAPRWVFGLLAATGAAVLVFELLRLRRATRDRE